MPTVVVDASFTFRLLLPNPQQTTVRGHVDQWIRDGKILAAPTLWLYEMASALVKTVHFGDLSQDEGRRNLVRLQSFPLALIAPDARLTEAAYNWSRQMQRANAYDAFYLALAQALDSELWTADRRLANAVQQPWVHSLI
jgi:predicted nucleic acid-binding protein